MGIVPTPNEVFYSYADADETLFIELDKHLSQLKRDGLIVAFHQRLIAPDMDWTKTVDSHLNTASVILLLISSDFLASDYCYSVEMRRAMERSEAGEAHVIPILLRSVDWQSALFGELRALPSSPGRAHPATVAVAQEYVRFLRLLQQESKASELEEAYRIIQKKDISNLF